MKMREIESSKGNGKRSSSRLKKIGNKKIQNTIEKAKSEEVKVAGKKYGRLFVNSYIIDACMSC